MKLTKKERSALESASRYPQQWRSAWELGHPRGVMRSLVRRGLVRSMTQEQRPLHEPRSAWNIYQISREGLQELGIMA